MEPARAHGRKDTAGVIKKRKKIFTAVYASRFGEHSSGVVLQYGFHSRPPNSSTTGDNNHGNTNLIGNQEKESGVRHHRVERKRLSREHKKELLQKQKGKKTRWKEGARSPDIPVLKLPKHGASRESAEQKPNQLTTKPQDIHQAKTHDLYEITLGKQPENEAKNRKKESESHNAVLKVISQMLEENSKYRTRLLQCSQKCTQATSGSTQSGSDVSNNNESLFGWL